MTEEQEAELLSLAVERGHVSKEIVEEVRKTPITEETPFRWSARIDLLVSKGYVDDATIEGLLRESVTAEHGPKTLALSFPHLQEEDETAFPIKDWDRYEFVRYLGEGGMGRVFLVTDPKLKRNVALKFLTGSIPGRSYRLMKEAQALARIRHENVCQVYEVGEIQGQLYIAMQYVDGHTMDRLGSSVLSLEQKVRIMEEVANGLHAVHEAGFIHRDIKPSNIMIEREADGTWHPYLMDFGVARETEEEGITRTGIVVGTPAYMAPEQAMLDGSQLDRRSDVYSLGATMYSLFAGRAPYSGTTPLGIIRQMHESEPEPLSKWNENIPDDLERIVSKCMEKQRERRYANAKELSQDLNRFLRGEPVLARPESRTARRLKRWIKHPAAIALLLALVGAAVLYEYITAKSRSEVQERLQLANEFSQEARYIDEYMRHALTAPLHDIRSERNAIRRRLKTFEAKVQAAGKTGAGPGSYVIGRGFLALQEYPSARTWLEKAWKSEYRVPEVAYALGMVYGELYQREIREAERIQNVKLRQNRYKEIEKEFRARALQYLRLSAGVQVESPEYAEALIAYYDQHYDAALQKSQAAVEKIPWLYEARLLRGQIKTDLANRARDTGSFENAARLYNEADYEYRQALITGQSDPRSYSGACSVWVQLMQMEVYGPGSDVHPQLKKAEEMCSQAITADPESSSAHLELSHAYKLTGEYELNHGEDPTIALNRSEELAKKAIPLAPASARPHHQIAIAYFQRGNYEMFIGKNPEASFAKSIEHSKASLSIEPNFAFGHNNIGICYLLLSEHQMNNGIDPEPSLKKAITAFQKATAINSQYGPAFNNMGNAYLTIAENALEQGKDPKSPAAEAIKSYQNSIRINPGEVYAYNNLALVYVTLGAYEIERGSNPEKNLNSAIEMCAKAIGLNPNYDSAYTNQGIAYLYLAEYGMDRGRNPEKLLQRAVYVFRKTAELNPNRHQPYTNLGSAMIDFAVYHKMTGKKFDEDLKAAEEWYRKAIEVNPTAAGAWMKLGRVLILKSEQQLESGKDPAALAKEAEKALNKAKEINAEDSEIYQELGRVSIIRGRHAISLNQNPSRMFEEAEKFFAESLKRFPENAGLENSRAEKFLVYAEWQLSQKEDPGAMIQKGIEAAQRALKISPANSESYVLLGRLQLLDAQKNPAMKQKGVESLQEALRINPNLKSAIAKLEVI